MYLMTEMCSVTQEATHTHAKLDDKYLQQKAEIFPTLKVLPPLPITETVRTLFSVILLLLSSPPPPFLPILFIPFCCAALQVRYNLKIIFYPSLLLWLGVGWGAETYEGVQADRQAERQAQADAQAQGETCIPPAWGRRRWSQSSGSGGHSPIWTLAGDVRDWKLRGATSKGRTCHAPSQALHITPHTQGHLQLLN